MSAVLVPSLWAESKKSPSCPQSMALISAGLKELTEKVRRPLLATSRQLIALDFDGTLAEFHRDPLAVRMNPQIQEKMIRLLEKGRSQIVIISGRDPDFLDREFSESRHPSFSRLMLVASHGLLIRRPGDHLWTLSVAEDPRQLVDSLDPFLLTLLSRLKTLDDRIWMEKKPGGRVIHYREAIEASSHPAAFMMTIKQAIDETQRYLIEQKIALSVIPGNSIFEIKSPLVSKGKVLQRLLTEEQFDRVIVAGDDVTDEAMFASLQDFPSPLRRFERIGIQVRQKSSPSDSLAPFKVDGVEQFARIFFEISEGSSSP